jgi:hypothetical protein
VAQAPDHRQQRLLGGILGVGVAPNDASAEAEDAVVVVPQQLFERRSVPGLRRGDERALRLGPVDRRSLLR